MSNDQYVVIVTQPDQAAQALAAVRAAGRVHVKEPAPAATRAMKGAAAPKGVAAHAEAVGGGGRRRTWEVATGEREYIVTGPGSGKGHEIHRDGVLVWVGTLAPPGLARTEHTTLEPETLKEVLRLAYTGGQREIAKEPRGKEPRSGPRTRPSGEAASHAAKAKPKRGRKSKEPAAGESAPTHEGVSAEHAEATHEPKAKRGRRAKAAKPAASSAKSKVKHAPKTKAPKGKRGSKAKSADAHAGPPTQRAPTAAPPAKPASHHGSHEVDDATVLEALMARLKKEDPATAEQSFASFKRIWKAGGREATVEWARKHKIPCLVDGFYDWMEKHFDKAQAMLQQAPHSAPKAAKVA